MSDAKHGSARRPSAEARRRLVVEAYTDEERRLGRYVRHAYAINRSAFESAKRSVEVRWQVPKRYDGVTKPSLDPQDAGKTAVNVWFEMARWFITRGLDAPAFVQYVFSRLDTRDRIPEPMQVCSEAHIKGFTEFVTKGVTAIVAGSFQTETRAAKSAFLSYHTAFAAEVACGGRAADRWEIAQNVILDQAQPLSPLFRYLLALSSARDAERAGAEDAKYRFLALANGLFDRAVVQFWVHRAAYAEHWRRWLPKTFVADATARFKKIAFNEAGDGDADVVA